MMWGYGDGGARRGEAVPIGGGEDTAMKGGGGREGGLAEG